jgi:NTE family protein
MPTSWSASTSPGFFDRAPGETYDPTAIGVCFSGGGYRATLFHAGAVIRMGELGLLPKIARFSSVSGGSITTGILAMAWSRLAFDHVTGVVDPAKLRDAFTVPILRATARSIDIGVGIAGLVPFISAGNKLAAVYDKFIFKGMKLKDIPQTPRFIFNATNLQTGGLFRFTRDYLADWRALSSTTKGIRLSEAVAASSAFPPVLAPLRLDLRGEEVTVPEGARWNHPDLLKEPILVDGGVYDNLGLEAVWKRCGIILASYAGHNAAAQAVNFTWDHLLPMVNAFLGSSIDWREQTLVALFRHKLADGRPERLGAYWTAGTQISNWKVPVDWQPTAAELQGARDLPTRLDRFTPADQALALNAGYAHADRAIRATLMPEAPPPAHPAAR